MLKKKNNNNCSATVDTDGFEREKQMPMLMVSIGKIEVFKQCSKPFEKTWACGMKGRTLCVQMTFKHINRALKEKPGYKEKPMTMRVRICGTQRLARCGNASYSF